MGNLSKNSSYGVNVALGVNYHPNELFGMQVGAGNGARAVEDGKNPGGPPAPSVQRHVAGGDHRRIAGDAGRESQAILDRG